MQFVTAPITGVNFGVILPSQYVDDTPMVTTSTFYPYAHDGIHSWRKSLLTVTPDGGVTSYDPTGPCPSGYNTPAVDTALLYSEIGTCFGLGYQSKRKTLFAGTYIKQFSDIGPQGTGAIYRINMNDESNPVVMNGTPNTATGTIDLNLLFGAGTCGANPFANAPSTGSYPDYNQLGDRIHVADAVYNVAFSDVDVSHDENRLFALSFADKKIYSIPIDGSPITSATVQSATIPVPAGMNLAEMRPTGMGVHSNGKVYVIVRNSFIVNTANNNTNIGFIGGTERYQYIYADSPTASPYNAVFEYDPITNTFNNTPILTFYGRMPNNKATSAYGGSVLYRDLTFDDQDAILLAGRILSQDVNGGATGGRVLRFDKDPITGVYTMETNSTVYNYHTNAYATSPGNPLYPSYWENTFYYQMDPTDGGVNDGMGGLAQIMGRNSVIETNYDGCDTYTGGVRTLSHDDGTSVRYQTTLPSLIYLQGTNGVLWDNKRGALGDLEVITDPAPLEIGNRVWNDTDEDGIQDAGEVGIDGITVQLYEGSTLVGTTATTNSGQWYFNDSNTTGGLKPNTTYTVRVQSNAGQILTGTNTDGTTNGDLRDSDASLVGGNAEITYTTGNYGENNHTLDIGFRVIVPDLSLTKTVSNAIVALNGTVTFTLTLTNDNGIDATGVVVTDVLPAGVTFVSSSDPTNVVVSGSTLTWNVGNMLGTDAPKMLDITVTANSEGSFLNNAEITDMNETDTDSTPNNDVIGEDDQDQACFSVPVTLCSDSPAASITITAATATTYQWYVSTDNGATYTALSGETNQTLVVNNTLMGGNNITKYFKVAYNGSPITGTCGDVMCCPVIITTQTCTVCPPPKCITIGITKH